ncbi:MAG: 4Fe-4S binding protein [Alphaproteobacteria bacterium]|nr:4Fe-4S binding protein [Alphaproteobacteria bacterium]
MNKFYGLYFIRKGLAFVVLTMCVLAFTNQFYPLPFLDGQVGALLTKLLCDLSVIGAVSLVVILFLTFLFGRFYCSVLCPFGVAQEAVMTLIRRKRNYQKRTFLRYLPMLVVFGTMIGGTTVVLRLLEPYTYFGSLMSGSIIGITATSIVFVLTVWKGRFFCTHICPVGTFLGLVARFSKRGIFIDKDTCRMCGLCVRECPADCIDIQNGKIDNESCLRCMKCFTACRFGAVKFGVKKEDEKLNLSRRDMLKAVGAGAVLLGSAGLGCTLKKQTTERAKDVILPPGAMNAERFLNSCLNCNLCVENCPNKIIKKADDVFDAVHLDYSKNACRFKCHKCSSVCPSGALKRLTLQEKQNLQIGMAVIDKSKCVKCGSCADICPKKAIRMKGGEFPQIDASECVGCGQCKKVCPAKAITVVAFREQHEIKGV